MCNKRGYCKKCMFFQSHDTFEYLGLCAYNHELKIKSLAEEDCDGFKEVKLEDLKRALLKRGGLRCLSCNKMLYTVEELTEHLEDELRSTLFTDIVASEEAPVAG